MCSGTSSVANVSSLSYSVLSALREACQSPVRTEAGASEILIPEERRRLRLELRTEMLKCRLCMCVSWCQFGFLFSCQKMCPGKFEKRSYSKEGPFYLSTLYSREGVCLKPFSTFSLPPVPASLPGTPVSVLYICRSLSARFQTSACPLPQRVSIHRPPHPRNLL